MITILLSPVLTNGTKKIVEQMNFNTKMLKFSNILKFDLLNNHKISEKTEPIYMRIEIEKNKN
jgi:methionyl-tRNA synthetase